MTGARPTRQERTLLDTHYNSRSTNEKGLVLIHGQLKLVVVIIYWHTIQDQYGHQYGDCNSYESDFQSVKCKSWVLPRVTNKRSTRKTSLFTVTVVNARTNLSVDQLKSRIQIYGGVEKNIRDGYWIIFSLGQGVNEISHVEETWRTFVGILRAMFRKRPTWIYANYFRRSCRKI